LKFVVDNALSPTVAQGLRDNGHDAVHVRDLGMAAASDEAILARALHESRTVVTADRDFGTLLAMTGASLPSVILFRGDPNSRPGRQILIILASLPEIEQALVEGCVVVFFHDQMRVRPLPIVRP
jgi:predicted nuclease of predicted toxin-antitoxin system